MLTLAAFWLCVSLRLWRVSGQPVSSHGFASFPLSSLVTAMFVRVITGLCLIAIFLFFFNAYYFVPEFGIWFVLDVRLAWLQQLSQVIVVLPVLPATPAPDVVAPPPVGRPASAGAMRAMPVPPGFWSNVSSPPTQWRTTVRHCEESQTIGSWLSAMQRSVSTRGRAWSTVPLSTPSRAAPASLWSSDPAIFYGTWIGGATWHTPSPQGPRRAPGYKRAMLGRGYRSAPG